MSNVVKLRCPKCDKQFQTNIKNKVWCSKRCSDDFRHIKSKIEINLNRQSNVRNKAFRYDLDNDKFYINNWNV